MMDTLTTITDIDRSLLKKIILESGIKQHQMVIEHFRKRIEEIWTNDVSKTDEYDTHQRSFRHETLAEVNILSDQLQLANQELDQLMRIRSYVYERHPCVEYGKVVKTNKEIFFISTAIDKFYAADISVIGLSVLSQLYKTMKGKEAGDYFTHENVTYEIIEIF